MSARLFVLLVVPAYVVLYAAIASSIKRRLNDEGTSVPVAVYGFLEARVDFDRSRSTF